MKYYLERISALAASAILLQTLYFKFTAAPESVYIFTALGMEPWGRIGVGLLELCIGLLLIFRKTSGWGALLGLGVITGALFAHLFVLGIEVGHDGLDAIVAGLPLLGHKVHFRDVEEDVDDGPHASHPGFTLQLCQLRHVVAL